MNPESRRPPSASVAKASRRRAQRRDGAPVPAAVAPRKRVAGPLFFALALFGIVAIGFWTIGVINASAIPLAGFPDPAAEHSAAEAPRSDVFISPMALETAVMMRTRGYLMPPRVVLDPPAPAPDARKRRPPRDEPELPAEIGSIPPLDADAVRMAGLDALPPLPSLPALSPNGGELGFDPSQIRAPSTAFGFDSPSRAALPPMPAWTGGGRLPSDATIVVERNTIAPAIEISPSPPSTVALPSADPLPQPPPITEPAPSPGTSPPSRPIDEPTRQAAVSPAPTSNPRAGNERRDAPAASTTTATSSLSLGQQQLRACGGLGFFARLNCENELQTRFCEGRWNRHPDCQRIERANNY